VQGVAAAVRRGYTLIEAMVVAALLAIGLAIALPNLVAPLRRARVDAASEALRAGLQLARSAALARAATVWLCPSADQRRCGGSWQQGWIVRAEADAAPMLVQQLPRDVTIGATRGLARGVRYSAEGWARGAPGERGGLQWGHFTLCSGDAGYAVVVAIGGRVRRQRLHCPADPQAELDAQA
jgi:type IV fimbrial biogenesis protein FimT